MNILFLESSIDPSRGGVQRVSYSLFEYFETHGISCYFAYFLVGYDKLSDDRKLFFDPNIGKKKLFQTFTEFVDKNRIDIVILQGINNRKILSVMEQIKKIHNCKLIYCLHQTPDYYRFFKESFRPKAFLFRMITGKTYMQRSEAYTFGIVDKYVLLSKSYVPFFCQLFGIKKRDKLDYIENPLPFIEEKISNKEKTVLIVSRFSEIQKNIKSALRIWKKVESIAVQDNWTLKIAGYGDDETMLLDYASSLNLKNVVFLGKANNPVPLYEKASIFIMTSFFEGLPMTLLEGMALGCVPIAFDSFKSLPDIIENDKNGFVISAFDEDSFAQKLAFLMKKEDLRNNMATDARESSKRFSIQSIGSKWLKLLENIND